MNAMPSGFLTCRGIDLSFHLTCLGDRFDSDAHTALHRATPCHWRLPYGLGQFPKTPFATCDPKAFQSGVVEEMIGLTYNVNGIFMI
jgi:hypothetical protein